MRPSSPAGAHGTPPQVIAKRCGSGDLVGARNEVVGYFLELDAEWLWWVDADMGFGPETLSRLIATADKKTRPIVGALCFGLREFGEDPETQALDFRCFPTLYAWTETDDDAGFATITEYPSDSIVSVGATDAAGCDLPVHVDTGISPSHQKGGVHLTESLWDEKELVRNLTAAQQ